MVAVIDNEVTGYVISGTSGPNRNDPSLTKWWGFDFTNGTTFDDTIEVSTVGQMPHYEMFGAVDIPFLGDYNWIQLVEVGDGSLFGYLSWTDNRDVVPGTDPREPVQDGFDVDQCQDETGANLCPNSGGLNQNIYGNSITIP